MGKRKKRMMKGKYARKYALKRESLGFNTRHNVVSGVVTIDMNTSEEVEAEKQVEVVSNKEEKVEKESPPWNPEPELQVVEMEQPQVETPPPIEAKKAVRKKRAPRKTTAKNTPTTRRTSTRKSTKKTEE